MRVMVFDGSDALVDLEPLFSEWQIAAAACSEEIGINTNVGAALQTCKRLMDSPMGSILVLVDDDMIVGLMGVVATPNHVGFGLIVHECLTYVMEGWRGHGPRLVRAAKRWAKARGASHIIFTASRLASVDSDRSGRFFQAMKCVPFEQTFIAEVG